MSSVDCSECHGPPNSRRKRWHVPVKVQLGRCVGTGSLFGAGWTSRVIWRQKRVWHHRDSDPAMTRGRLELGIAVGWSSSQPGKFEQHEDPANLNPPWVN